MRGRDGKEGVPGLDSSATHTHTFGGSPDMHEAVNTVGVYRLCCKHRNLLLHYLPQISVYACVCMCVSECVLHQRAKHVFLACAVLLMHYYAQSEHALRLW